MTSSITLTPTVNSGPGWQAALAVETTRIGSAGLSASYYALLGLAVPPVAVHGVTIPAAAIALGALAAAMDYAKGTMLSVGLGGRGSGFLRRSAALGLGLVLFVASAIAIDGVIMKLRSMTSEAPAHVITTHDETTKDLKAVKAKLLTLADVPTTLQVQAEMSAAPVSKAAFNATKQCNDFEGWLADYRKACKPILELRIKMASAIDKADLQERRDELQAKLDGLGPKPAAADPQATAIANVTGLPESFVLLVLAGVLGIALELVSCFGRYALDRPAPKAPLQRSGIAGWFRREAAPVAVHGQPDVPAVDLPAQTFRKRPDRPAGGSLVIRLPKGPRPSAPDVPAGSSDKPASELERRKADVLSFIREENAVTGPIPSQAYLAEMTDVPDATLSDWLAAWEADGTIIRQVQGRRKVIVAAPERQAASA